jgi:hypothetical protein
MAFSPRSVSEPSMGGGASSHACAGDKDLRAEADLPAYREASGLAGAGVAMVTAPKADLTKVA